MRVYPSCCTSYYCGKTDCTGCINLPVLQEFKKWVKETGAVRKDPIWCPNVYTIPGEKENKELGEESLDEAIAWDVYHE